MHRQPGAVVLDGSSPRMRGKPVARQYPIGRGRIIPAHAGQTNRPRGIRGQGADHPRACGANSSARRISGASHGSSPRMRGKRVRVLLELGVNRIIPAHAGQTIAPRYQQTMCPDHPRACGANRQKKLPTPRQNGSSPRMRGKRRLLFVFHCFLRIIPAHAGQTRFSPRAAGHTSDHPRACGANGVDALWDKLKDGSSPRMRGKPVRCVVDIVVLRIIPAHAGQTPCDERERRSRTDHPRACGANNDFPSNDSDPEGSSPRMRGKHRSFSFVTLNLRIIPAHAGQTTLAWNHPNTTSDHPRACGANDVLRAGGRQLPGSSPRMRGKHGIGVKRV